MSRRIKWVLALVVVLALAGMGIAYGAWTQDLTFKGQVTSATFRLELQTDGQAAPSTVEKLGNTDNDPANMDVAQCTSTIGTGPQGDEFQITMKNAYPGYECSTPLLVTNRGSIPVEIVAPGSVFSHIDENIQIVTQSEALDCTTSSDYEIASGGGAYCYLKLQVKPGVTEMDGTYTVNGYWFIRQWNSNVVHTEAEGGEGGHIGFADAVTK